MSALVREMDRDENTFSNSCVSSIRGTLEHIASSKGAPSHCGQGLAVKGQYLHINFTRIVKVEQGKETRDGVKLGL